MEDILHVGMPFEHLFCSNALDRLHHSAREHIWYALEEKVYMILINADLNKVDFVSFGYFKTYCFDRLCHRSSDNVLSIFDRTDQMVQKECLIVSSIDMIGHT